MKRKKNIYSISNEQTQAIDEFIKSVKELREFYFNGEVLALCEDEDYLKLRDEKWREWVSVNVYAVYDFLNQFSYITISKDNITEFENKIEYFDGHPEYSELIKKIKKLRNI